MMASFTSAPTSGIQLSSVHPSINDGSIDYYDIMIIGKTGMGKSSTSDKLVIATDGELTCRGEYQDDDVQLGGRLVGDDLGVWLISDADGEMDRIREHLSQLMGFRSDKSMSDSVNSYYKDNRPTHISQLVSNETTKIRVLDVPGFFGHNDSEADGDTSANASEVAITVTKAGLKIMRQILHMQEAMKLNFKRIIYFIPERGPLERPNKILQIELETMVHYFGKSIFDCMVLVTTVNSDIYQYLPPGIVPFSQDAEMQTRANFNATVERVLKDHLPEGKPPIVFMSMRDSCDEIVTKIRNAPVIHDGIRLTFDHQTCARCGMKEKILNQLNEGKGKESAKMACYIGEDPSVAIPHADSLCHPMIISKYWKLTKVLGGIVHFVTRKRYLGRWPDFRNPDDEICIHCKQVPGSRGCLKVGTPFELKGAFFRVDHSHVMDEKVKIDISDVGNY